MKILGCEDMYGPRQQQGLSPREAVMWLAVRHKDKGALQLFSGEIAPAGTGMGEGRGRGRGESDRLESER